MASGKRRSANGEFTQFSISLPSEQVAQLDAIARGQHTSRNVIVRQLLDLGLEQRRRQVAAAEAVA